MKIISRRDALAAGLTRYFTGKPCKNGHAAERYTSDGRCVVCSMERNREHRQKPGVKERLREHQREYQQKPKGKKRIREYQQEYWQRPGVKERRRHNKYCKNGTIPTRPMPDFCECRGCIPDKRGLVIEHCHKTNKFRGWVCGNCNTGIGMLGDTVEGLMHAVEYLRRAGG